MAEKAQGTHAAQQDKPQSRAAQRKQAQLEREDYEKRKAASHQVTEDAKERITTLGKGK